MSGADARSHVARINTTIDKIAFDRLYLLTACARILRKGDRRAKNRSEAVAKAIAASRIKTMKRTETNGTLFAFRIENETIVDNR